MDSGTTSYLVRRLMWVPVILFVVSFVTFALGRLGPGDPVRVAAGQFRDDEAFERIRAARGLDKPVYEQYYIYMEGVLTRMDLGESFRYQDYDVSEIIFPAIWRSAQYNAVVLVLTLSMGIPLGVFAARRQGTWADPASISFFLFLQSIYSLISVPFLLLFLALKLGWLPASGWPRDCNVTLDFLPQGYECIGVLSAEAVIPIIALSLPAVAIWGRYTRAFTLEVMREDYVRTARAKGIPESKVMTRHVLRNALLPLSTMIIFSLVGLLEGSFFVETLTGIPGIGRLAFEAIGGRDYDMIMAIVMLGAVTFVLASIVVDIVYTMIDPRIRYGARSN
ncbi:MAG: ABC transporter permease subunit [Dehalococcoidia bacterium]|nr:ABC transporter permease subunit [Dehalococcoidia bacterium]